MTVKKLIEKNDTPSLLQMRRAYWRDFYRLRDSGSHYQNDIRAMRQSKKLALMIDAELRRRFYKGGKK